MSRRLLLSTTTGVLLLVAPTMAAWAGPHNTAQPHPTATTGSFGFGGSSAPNPYNVSTALSTALSVGGTTEPASINSNLIGPGNGGLGIKKGPVVQFNSAPTVQTAIGAAVSIGGNASAAAINTNDALQSGQH